ncbi:MAG: hypothetical protein WBP93_07565 [Pyrinomonadaceae bacterium]
MRRSVIAAVDDMFFASKIRVTAEHLGVDVQFARSAEMVIEAARESEPALVIIDLHSKRLDPFALAAELKAGAGLSKVRLIGFFSHVQTELQRRAKEAGFDSVLPRSAFTKQLAEILRGSEE